MHYLDELNPAQKEAVIHFEGPALIIAGPGSGKTRVLTYRIAFMLENAIDPFHILSLTFTNKAAREMKERIQKIAGREARNLWMGTFHSIFARILRIESEKLGYPANFTIYDSDDAKSLIKKIVKEMGLNDKIYKASTVYNRISAAKNSLITSEEYAADSFLTAEDEAGARPKIAEIYSKYALRCFQAAAMDFDDLLLKMYLLLKKYPEVLYKYQQKFKFILIDEFQDTNHAQYSIVKMLGDIYENIAVVGDDAQSIYAFRGANIQNILNFERDYPDLKIYKLEQNYRSTQAIVKVANHIITHNKSQLPKTIWTSNDEGEKIKVYQAPSDNEEGKLVADRIFELKMREHLYDDGFAILYRTNAQSRAFEEALRRKNIPYRVYGGVSFYQRKEVKDYLAYLRLTVNPKDEEALRRVINYPTRGIGKTTMEKLSVWANEAGSSLWEIIMRIHEYPLSGRARQSLEDFATMIRSFASWLDKKDAFELAEEIGRSTGILKDLYNDRSIEGQSRYENVQELLSSIKEFTENPPEAPEGEDSSDTGLGSYLQNVALLTDMDQEGDDVPRVKLMTVHAAKGLEFPAVFVVGMEENLFPSMMALDSREGLEEERRLFYVAVTRAEKYLHLSYASTRFRFGNLLYCEPSRFIEELPPEIVEFKGLKSRKVKTAAERQADRSSQLKKQLDKLREAKKAGYQHQPSDEFRPDDPAEMQVGMEVEHPRFGFGKITSMDGPADNRIAHIFFQKAGNKRIMLKYAKLHILRKKQ